MYTTTAGDSCPLDGKSTATIHSQPRVDSTEWYHHPLWPESPILRGSGGGGGSGSWCSQTLPRETPFIAHASTFLRLAGTHWGTLSLPMKDF